MDPTHLVALPLGRPAGRQCSHPWTGNFAPYQCREKKQEEKQMDASRLTTERWDRGEEIKGGEREKRAGGACPTFVSVQFLSAVNWLQGGLFMPCDRFCGWTVDIVFPNSGEPSIHQRDEEGVQRPQVMSHKSGLTRTFMSVIPLLNYIGGRQRTDGRTRRTDPAEGMPFMGSFICSQVTTTAERERKKRSESDKSNQVMGS